MKKRTLLGIWRLGEPQWVWTGFPVWLGSIFAGLDRAPTLNEWGSISLFLVTIAALISTCCQYANNYADRYEDHIYCSSNPLVTGQLNVGTAKKAFILQNILCGFLLIALLIVTLDFWLIIALIIGWALGLTYNLPPLRTKETAVNSFHFGLGMALNPIVAWLAVSSLNSFIIAYAAFFFLHQVAYGTTNQLRKTYEAVRSGHIQIADGSSIYDTGTVIKLKVRTAVALEAIAGLGAFILIPIYWHLAIFDMELSIALLTLPLLFVILTVIFRIKNPVDNNPKCEQFMGMSVLFVVFSFLSVALIGAFHWALIIPALIFFLAVFALLQRAVRPFGTSCRPLHIWTSDPSDPRNLLEERS